MDIFAPFVYTVCVENVSPKWVNVKENSAFNKIFFTSQSAIGEATAGGKILENSTPVLSDKGFLSNYLAK